MKSARVHAFTEQPTDIRIEDVPIPEPGRGQVRVRMLMSPVNPSDFHYVRGTYYQALERIIWNQGRTAVDPRVCFDPARGTECPAPPYTLGGEGVGIFDACGGGFLAKRLKGKRVAVAGGGPPNGLWQEFAVVDAKRAVAVPDNLVDEQAAMYLANPISAYVLVREVLKVSRASWVLITAAGSALGKSVVRMGKGEGFYLGNWMAQQSPLKLLGVLRAVKRLTAEGVFHTDVSGTYPLDQVAMAVAASLQQGRTGKVMLRIGSR